MRDRRYRCSDARKEALLRLKTLKAGAVAASKNSIPASVRDMAFHSAIFQASATLEEYIKQIFDHWLFELKNNGLSGANLPSRARFSYFGRQVSGVFSNYFHGRDEKALAQSLQSRSGILDFAMGYADVPAHLNGEFAYKGKKYPSPSNIRALYSRIGCDNIFADLSREMRSDAELTLQGFNDIRTAIAHGNPPNITLIDVKRNIENVECIIRSLDKVSHKEFSKDFGGGVW